MTDFRRPLIAGNWKLHNTVAETRGFVAALRAALAQDGAAEVAVAPAFTALMAAAEELAGSSIALAAQDCYWEAKGAFTGEIAPGMLAELGVRYVIVGHSERRQHFGDSDEFVNRKAAAVLDAEMVPIVCVGESLEQREAGQTEQHVLEQVKRALSGLTPERARSVVIAYEPIWAIGTGRNARPEDAQAVHAAIRGRLSALYSRPLSESVRILYGGSVKPANAVALLAEPDIDGALVGGASLEVDSFAAIVKAAEAEK